MGLVEGKENSNFLTVFFFFFFPVQLFFFFFELFIVNVFLFSLNKNFSSSSSSSSSYMMVQYANGQESDVTSSVLVLQCNYCTFAVAHLHYKPILLLFLFR